MYSEMQHYGKRNLSETSLYISIVLDSSCTACVSLQEKTLTTRVLILADVVPTDLTTTDPGIMVVKSPGEQRNDLS